MCITRKADDWVCPVHDSKNWTCTVGKSSPVGKLLSLVLGEGMGIRGNTTDCRGASGRQAGSRHAEKQEAAHEGENGERSHGRAARKTSRPKCKQCSNETATQLEAPPQD
eukprot:3622102-Pleurochrysis_carterae.AAC.1